MPNSVKGDNSLPSLGGVAPFGGGDIPPYKASFSFLFFTIPKLF